MVLLCKTRTQCCLDLSCTLPASSPTNGGLSATLQSAWTLLHLLVSPGKLSLMGSGLMSAALVRVPCLWDLEITATISLKPSFFMYWAFFLWINTKIIHLYWLGLSDYIECLKLMAVCRGLLDSTHQTDRHLVERAWSSVLIQERGLEINTSQEGPLKTLLNNCRFLSYTHFRWLATSWLLVISSEGPRKHQSTGLLWTWSCHISLGDSFLICKSD